MHSKKKHIPIKYHFLREKVTKQSVKLEYIHTKEHVIDIFTKPLPQEVFEYLRQKLEVVPMSSNHLSATRGAHGQEERREQAQGPVKRQEDCRLQRIKLRVQCKGEKIPFPLMSKTESTEKGGDLQQERQKKYQNN